MSNTKITYAELEAMGACSNGLAWFRSRFGDEVDETDVDQATTEALRSAEGRGYLCWVVAENVSCPTALLERLAGSKNRRVRRAAALNTSCPIALLERLVGDEDRDVRWEAKDTLRKVGA